MEMGQDTKSNNKRSLSAWISKFFLLLLILLFTVILLGGLYFKAPWKILVLDALLLALLTIVPKKFRKSGWLSLASAALVLVVWIFLPESTSGDWKPYILEEEIKAFNKKYTVPDDQNAAVIYNRISDTLDIFQEREKFWEWDLEDKTLHNDWTKEQYPEIADWIDANQEIIKSLNLASEKEFYKLPCSFNGWSFRKYHHMYRLRFLSKILLRASHYENSDLEQKIEKQIVSYTLGAHLTDENQSISVLSGFGIKLAALDELKKTIISSNITEQHSANINQAIQKNRFDWQKRFPEIVDYNILYSKNFQISLRYEKNAENKTRLTRHNNLTKLILPEEQETFSDLIKKASKTYQSPARIKLHRIKAWLTSMPTPEELLKIIDDAYEPSYTIADASFDWSVAPEDFSFFELELNHKYLQELYFLSCKSNYYELHNKYIRNYCHEHIGSWLSSTSRCDTICARLTQLEEPCYRCF